MSDLKLSCMLTKYNRMVDQQEIVFDELQVGILRELAKYNNLPRQWWKFWQKRSALPKRGVYLYGDVGRGKSLIAGLFYDNCSLKRKSKMHFNVFMKRIHELLHDARLGTKTDVEHIVHVTDNMVGEIELLYIDEVQVRDICEAVVLHRVFSALFSRKMTVLMTSNYCPSKLYEDGVQRELFLPAIDLLEEKMEILELPGKKDYRAIKSTQKGKTFYFGEKADLELRKCFLVQINHQPTKEASFTLDNRSISIGETYGDTALFSFVSLCGNKNPLWTSDYRKIAESFENIFIQGIPKFDMYKQNEMQRFIVLIDELYEHKNRLFCSFDTEEVERIYTGRMTPDIKRAISRLHEMGSESWL